MFKPLAILQNQWFRDPIRVQAIYDRRPEIRNDLIERFLFNGCVTGRRLLAAFGESLCSDIIWEEASPNVGGFSESKFPADITHIRNAIRKFQPSVILAFGKIATNGVTEACDAWTYYSVYPPPIISGPHPAARGADVVVRLHDMKARLIKSHPTLQAH